MAGETEKVAVMEVKMETAKAAGGTVAQLEMAVNEAAD